MDIINAYVKYNIFGKNKTIHVMSVTNFFVNKGGGFKRWSEFAQQILRGRERVKRQMSSKMRK